MIMTLEAVYEGGVLRPREPLALAEGEAVQVTVMSKNSGNQRMRPPTPAEEDYARRMKAAKTLQEMFAIMDSAPPEDNDDYDLCEALNANRRANDERLLFPENSEGSTP
ncbi:MAG TPA: antitoxin family protein [Gemmataceae bacterium]|nr:antitoxin family protein [Gemmataceae bacterium]